jgi:hypothetical protein
VRAYDAFVKSLVFILGLLVLASCEADKVDARIGAACDGNDDCENRCLPPSNDYPGGLCTVSCNVDSDCQRDDVVCTDREGGVCLYLCRDDRDCAFLNPQGGGTWQCKETNTKDGLSALVCRGD